MKKLSQQDLVSYGSSKNSKTSCLHFFLKRPRPGADVVWSASDLGKQCKPRSDCFRRSSLIRVFPVCYSCNNFVNSIPDNHILFEKKKQYKIGSPASGTGSEAAPMALPFCWVYPESKISSVGPLPGDWQSKADCLYTSSHMTMWTPTTVYYLILEMIFCSEKTGFTDWQNKSTFVCHLQHKIQHSPFLAYVLFTMTVLATQ